MARKRRSKFKISPLAAGGLVLIAGVGLYFILRPKKQAFVPQQSYIPPAPANNTANTVAAWAQAIFSIYGNAKQLWEPGGPFYKPSPQVQQVLNSMNYVKPF